MYDRLMSNAPLPPSLQHLPKPMPSLHVCMHMFVTPDWQNHQPSPGLYMRLEHLSQQMWVDSPHKRDVHCVWKMANS